MSRGVLVEYFSKYFCKLIDNGYAIVPIAKGYKYPKGFAGWQKTKFTKTLCGSIVQKNKAMPNHGIGIKTGESFKLIAVDIDIYEKDVTDQVVAWLKENVGQTIQRTGTAPKTLLVYQKESNFGKQTSKSYMDCIGVKNQIEILGNGNQFVAYHTHPDTSKPYCWGERSPLNMKADSLPIITEEHIKDLFFFLDRIKPTDWEVFQKGSRSKELDEDNPLIGFKGRESVDIEELKKVLDSIPANDYKTWINVGMALFHQFEGKEPGLSIWDRWSSRDPKYKKEEIPVKWGSFQQNLFCREPVTAGTIFYLGKKEGVKPEKPVERKPTLLQAFLGRYVYITEGDNVCDMSLPPHLGVMKLQEFRNTTANQTILVHAKTPTGTPTEQTVPVSKLWMCDETRKTVRGFSYLPGEDRLHKDAEGVEWINTFHFPDHGEVDDRYRLAEFDQHMEYLFPIESERDWFVDWMAFTIQRPEMRCKVTPLHISSVHGTGRGWIVELMAALIGGWNCTETKMRTFCGEGSAGEFQDYLHRSKFCSIAEVRTGGKRYEIDDRIRALLESPRLELNLKYGGKSTCNVYTNLFMQSNHPTDALYIPPEDRRIQVLTGPESPKDNAYYENLYGWIKKADNIHQLWSVLSKRDLSNFNYQRCTHTEGRAVLVSGIESDADIAVQHLLNKYGELERGEIASRVTGVIGRHVDEKQITAILKKLGKKSFINSYDKLAVK